MTEACVLWWITYSIGRTQFRTIEVTAIHSDLGGMVPSA
jgi:hypothetical protein